MKRFTLFFVLFGFTFSPRGYPSQEYSPDYLLQGIAATLATAEGKRLHSDDAQAYGYTTGLIIGISDTLNTFDSICTPAGTTILDMVISMKTFLTGSGYEDLVKMFEGLPSGPEPVDESVMVMFALKTAYPCEE